ncbi:uncharacterized protein LOC144154795 [Haemaphysalis longicornis]
MVRRAIMFAPLLLIVALTAGSTQAHPQVWDGGPLSLEADPEPGDEVANSTVIWPSDSRRCECIGYECGCCVNISAPRFGIKDKACSNVTYYPDQYAMSFTISIDDNVVLNRTVSGRNPPAICWPEQLVQLCVHFYNMTYHRTEVDGCVRLEGVIAREVIVSYDLGCYVLDDDAVKTRLKGLRKLLLDAIRRTPLPGNRPNRITTLENAFDNALAGRESNR